LSIFYNSQKRVGAGTGDRDGDSGREGDGTVAAQLDQ